MIMTTVMTTGMATRSITEVPELVLYRSGPCVTWVSRHVVIRGAQDAEQ